MNYEVEGIIVKTENGYNVLDENKNPLLDYDYPSLRKLLMDIANNL